MEVSYELWRASYQDAELAAKAAFDLAAERWREQERLRTALEHVATYPRLRSEERGYAEIRKLAFKALRVPNGQGQG